MSMVADDSPQLVRERGESWYSFGHRHLEQRNMKDAAKCFIKASNDDRGDIASACQWAGLVLGKIGRTEQALRFLDRSLELEVDREFRASSHFGRALILNDLGKKIEAVEACMQAYSLDRYDPSYMRLLGMLLNEDIISTYSPTQSIPTKRKEPSAEHKKFVAIAEKTCDLLGDGQTDRARPHVEWLLENNPAAPMTIAAHAWILELDEEFQEASDKYVELSTCYLADNENDLALKAVQQAFKITPNSPAAWLAYGRVMVKQKNLYEAEKAFKRGKRRKKDNPHLGPLLLELGLLYYERNEMPKAEGAARQSIGFHSTSQAWALQGTILLHQKRYAEAKEALQEADLLGERSETSVFVGLGLAYLVLGEKEHCRERFREVIEIYSRDQKHLRKYANHRLGHILQGTKDEAKTWVILLETLQILQAAKVLPLVAQIAIGEVTTSGKLWYFLHLTSNDDMERDTALMTAVELDPDDPIIMLANILSFYDAGLKRDAYDLLQRVPTNSPVRDKADKWMEVIEEDFEMAEAAGEYYDRW